MQSADYKGFYEYLEADSAKLFTVVLLPKTSERFPVVIIRTPYVDAFENADENKIVFQYMSDYNEWLNNNYAVVIQHCRGRGKSGGDCIPYINERTDGVLLQNWIRNQDFYSGEIFLKGASYLTSVHYATAPFGEDIKGAVFGIQDCERYNICYRNGAMKIGLHASWYVGMYKAKSHLKKNFVGAKSFEILPLSKFSEMVFGENVEDFDEMIRHPLKSDPFWNTLWGGNDARNAVKSAKFPILLTTGFYDVFTGGIFDMWNNMDEASRKLSALVVSPYDHSDDTQSIVFPNGKRMEQFGDNYEIKWFNYIRGREEKCPFVQGKVTYYNLFDNKWKIDDFKHSNEEKLLFGEETYEFVYNPYAPPKFNGGLSCNSGGAQFQDKPNSRYDIISVYSAPFEEETQVKGKMLAKLCVKSDCEDTGFYVRLSITKDDKDYGLRDDITSLCFQHPDYVPNSEVMLDFSFDEHSFLIKKGERIRMDISSADAEHFVRHTNMKGLFSEQETAKIAHNSINLKKSYVILPTEKT